MTSTIQKSKSVYDLNKGELLSVIQTELRAWKLIHKYQPEDIYQEVMYQYEKYKAKVKAPKAWVNRVIRNTITGYAKKQYAQKKSLLQYKEEIVCQKQFRIDYQSSLMAIFDRNRRDLLYQALGRMEEEYPEDYLLIQMRFFEELSWKEIAAVKYSDEVVDGEVDKKLVSRARKAGERALGKLYKIFNDL